MFAEAINRVVPFTHPVIISKRRFSGKVECACASFIILNAEGWIMTAAHVIGDSPVKAGHDRERTEYEAAVAALAADRRLKPKQLRQKIDKLPRNPQWITSLSYWWLRDGVRAQDFRVDTITDLALGRLSPFDRSQVAAFPVFRDPADELTPGTSLCRLGFPFHEITGTYEEATDAFRLAEGTLPVPRFPLDAIYTRGLRMRDPTSGREAELIETSSPGLMGQSGGPIFDVQGRVCGLQTTTFHLPLGFSPVVRRDGKDISEHQFLNVGAGPHVKEILSFLRGHGVKVEVG